MPEAVVSRLLGALPSTKSRTTRTTSPITEPGTGRPAQKATVFQSVPLLSAPMLTVLLLAPFA